MPCTQWYQSCSWAADHRIINPSWSSVSLQLVCCSLL